MKRAIGVLVILIICAAGFLTIKGIFPLLPISDDSMEPLLPYGSLVTVKDVNPENIAVGDIVVCDVSEAMREYYNYPAIVVRRVIEIKTTPSPGFRTEGDNASEDPFIFPPQDIRGKVGTHVLFLGLPLLLFKTLPGLILLIILLLALVVFLFRREISHAGAIIRQRIPLSPGSEREIDDMMPERKIRAVKKKTVSKEREQPLPDEVIMEAPEPSPVPGTVESPEEAGAQAPVIEPEAEEDDTGEHPLPGEVIMEAPEPSPVTDSSRAPRESPKHERLTEEAQKAEKELDEALNRLKNILNKYKS